MSATILPDTFRLRGLPEPDYSYELDKEFDGPGWRVEWIQFHPSLWAEAGFREISQTLEIVGIRHGMSEAISLRLPASLDGWQTAEDIIRLLLREGRYAGIQ